MTRPVVPPPITDVVAPLGPNGRAIMERCGFDGCAASRTDKEHAPCLVPGDCICEGTHNDLYCHDFVPRSMFERNLRRRQEERIAWYQANLGKQPSPRPTVVQPTKHHKRIVAVIKAAVEHRRQPCYGVKMTDAQVDELSRGIAQNLICNFKIEEAP